MLMPARIGRTYRKSDGRKIKITAVTKRWGGGQNVHYLDLEAKATGAIGWRKTYILPEGGLCPRNLNSDRVLGHPVILPRK